MLGAIGVILGLILALAVGYFAVLNQTPVSVTLWPGLAPRSAFIWEIAGYAAIAGWLVAMLFLLAPLLATQRRYRLLRRRVRELEARMQPARPIVGEAGHTALENGLETADRPLGRAVPAHADEEPV